MIAVVGKTRAHSAFRNSTFILAIIALSIRPEASHQPSASHIYRFVSADVHRCSGGLTSGSDGHRRRLPRIRDVRSFGVCSVSGTSTYSAASGLDRTLTVLATPSYPQPFHLQPRRVRSDGLSLRRSGMAIFPAVSFLFAFSVFGERATAYFSCTKLGRQLDFPPAH